MISTGFVFINIVSGFNLDVINLLYLECVLNKHLIHFCVMWAGGIFSVCLCDGGTKMITFLRVTANWIVDDLLQTHSQISLVSLILFSLLSIISSTAHSKQSFLQPKRCMPEHFTSGVDIQNLIKEIKAIVLNV